MYSVPRGTGALQHWFLVVEPLCVSELVCEISHLLFSTRGWPHIDQWENHLVGCWFHFPPKTSGRKEEQIENNSFRNVPPHFWKVMKLSFFSLMSYIMMSHPAFSLRQWHLYNTWIRARATGNYVFIILAEFFLTSAFLRVWVHSTRIS